MANYEVTPIRIPTNKQEAEHFEKWLEQVSARGGELVTTMASGRSDTVIGIFRSAEKGAVRWEAAEE